MPRTRLYKVHEVMSILENDPDFHSATVFIAPPLDHNCSDEDSGDEEGGSVDNLTRRQLESDAEVTIQRGATRIRLGMEDDDDDCMNDSFNPEPDLNSLFSTTPELSIAETSTLTPVTVDTASVMSSRRSRRTCKPYRILQESAAINSTYT